MAVKTIVKALSGLLFAVYLLLGSVLPAEAGIMKWGAKPRWRWRRSTAWCRITNCRSA